MTKRELMLVMVVVFMFGCVTTQVVKELVVPKLHAGQTAQKWEYTCTGLPAAGFSARETYAQKEMTPLLNKYGSEGWEQSFIITPQLEIICFKRPLN